VQQVPQSIRAWGGLGVALGRVPPHPTHEWEWRGSGLRVFGVRALAVQGRNMEKNTLGENSAELSSSVGEIEYKQGQEVWMPVGGRTGVFLTPGLEGQLFTGHSKLKN